MKKSTRLIKSVVRFIKPFISGWYYFREKVDEVTQEEEVKRLERKIEQEEAIKILKSNSLLEELNMIQWSEYNIKFGKVELEMRGGKVFELGVRVTAR